MPMTLGLLSVDTLEMDIVIVEEESWENVIVVVD